MSLQKLFLPFSVFILLLSCTEEQQSVEQAASNSILENLSVRNAHSMVYNPVDERVILFGGADHEKVLSDLWVLEAGRWTKLKPETSPEPRTFASLIFDDKENRLVLFGGSQVLFGEKADANNLLNDTWIFKNNQWHKLLKLPLSPTRRAEAGIAFDESSGQIVLFGGYTIEDNQYIKLADTWIFENERWREVNTRGPSARHGVTMWYDKASEQILLFGGSTVDKQYGSGKGETWAWRNNAWEKLQTQQPAGVFNPVAAYDSKNNSLLLFGGWDGKKRVDYTLRYKNQEWQKMTLPFSPSPRNHSQMLFDKAHSRVLLYGGHDGETVFGDLWEFKDNSWTKLSEVQPLARAANSH